MNKKHTKFFNAKVVLLLVILFHCAVNYFWFKNDGYSLPGTHSVWLEERAFAYNDALFEGKHNIFNKVLVTMEFFNLKRADYMISSSNFSLGSFFIALVLATNLSGYVKLFLMNSFLFVQVLLLLFAVYYLGKIIFDKTVGAWGAIILSFYPGVIGLSRKLSQEVLAAFFIVVSIVVFIRWKNIAAIFRPLVLFIVFSFGVFSGPIFFVFFAPLFLLHRFLLKQESRAGVTLKPDCPLVDRRFQTVRNLSREQKQVRWEFFVFSALFLIFVHFYFNAEYGKVFLNLTDAFHRAAANLIFNSGNWVGSAGQGIIGIFLFASQESMCACTQSLNTGLNLKTLSFYPLEMIYYVSLIFFSLAVLSLFFLFRDKRIDSSKKLFLGVWAGAGYILLSLFYIKWGKFVAPLLPFLALSSSAFICRNFKKIEIKQIVVLFLGVLTTVYYSFFAISSKHILENLSENIISYRPQRTEFVETAKEIAAIIDNNSNKLSKINLIYLDKDSKRFFGKGWVNDTSLRFNHLIRIFIKHKHLMRLAWSLSDEFHNELYKQNFIVLIANEKLGDIDNYLFTAEAKPDTNIKFKIVFEKELNKSVVVYLINLQRGEV